VVVRCIVVQCSDSRGVQVGIYITRVMVGTYTTRGLAIWDIYHTNHGTCFTRRVISHTSKLGHVTLEASRVGTSITRIMGHISRESYLTRASWDICITRVIVGTCIARGIASWDIYHTSQIPHERVGTCITRVIVVGTYFTRGIASWDMYHTSHGTCFRRASWDMYHSRHRFTRLMSESCHTYECVVSHI